MDFKKTSLCIFVYSLMMATAFAGGTLKSDDSLPSLVMTDLSFMPSPRTTPENYMVLEYQAYNVGRGEASGVIMTNQPRNGFIYISHQCAAGWTPQAYRSADGSVVAACEGGTLAPGADARMEITVKSPFECMSSPYVPLINRASIYSRNTEMNYSDNEVETLIYLLACSPNDKPALK